jgi:hypothetical protein
MFEFTRIFRENVFLPPIWVVFLLMDYYRMIGQKHQEKSTRRGGFYIDCLMKHLFDGTFI